MTSEVGKLEEQALKRKERLKAWREKQGGETGDEQLPSDVQEQQSLPKPIFRSYQPLNESLKEHQLPKAKPIEVIEIVRDQLEAAKPEPLVEEVDLMNLAPCKPDWDLKRDIAKKLDKLERRTQRAIAEIIRERIFAEKDLAAVASWIANDGEVADSNGIGSKTSSLVGPKMRGSDDVSKSVTANLGIPKTADVGFDDDSD